MVATTGLEVPAVAGIQCMLWLWGRARYPARRQGHGSEHREP